MKWWNLETRRGISLAASAKISAPVPLVQAKRHLQCASAAAAHSANVHLAVCHCSDQHCGFEASDCRSFPCPSDREYQSYSQLASLLTNFISIFFSARINQHIQQ